MVLYLGRRRLVMGLPGVGFRQCFVRAGFLDGESSGSIASLQVFEAVDWDAGSACCELQQT